MWMKYESAMGDTEAYNKLCVYYANLHSMQMCIRDRPKSVQKLLGHGSLQLTMDLYCHVTDDTLFDEMRKMEAVESV